MAIQYGLQRRDFVAANGENQHQGHFSRLKVWRDKLDWKERQSRLEKSAEARG